MSTAERVLSAMAGELQTLIFRFESSADPAGSWRVVEVRSREAISELYACTVDLSSEQFDADADALLGSTSRVLISRGPITRRLCGVVHRVEHTGTRGRHHQARVHLVPALWGLSQRRDSYIFQDKTVPQILEEVLGEGLQPFERTFRIQTAREYLPREYCVQYRETDLDFALRLMEEEGLFFWFDHSGDAEELVVVEQNDPAQPCETAQGPISLGSPRPDTTDESFERFELHQQLQPTSVVVRDFNWTHPDFDLTHQARGQDRQGMDREIYDYPTPLLGPYDAGARRYGYERAHQEELRRQELQVGARGGSGTGNVVTFTPGYKFDLAGHLVPALDGAYLLTRVEQRGRAPEDVAEREGEAGAVLRAPEPARYENTFEAIPLDVPFRAPRRRARARIAGLQSATVVGPNGEEIHTDEHGRIKVQFHWDRVGQRDEHSSCFLRVAQTWAGAGWGFMFLPRIGMEVLVDFLEGDPDRPIVVGCVYNGLNTPPYPLPDNKTRSTIRTSSSKASDGYNELRFEDAAGSEEVFLHAQKDLVEVVEHDHHTTVHHDHSTTVDANQTNSVGGNHTESVGGAQSLTVDKNRTVHVKGSQSVTIDGGRAADGVSGGKMAITGDWKVDASKTISIQAPDQITVTCGGSSITMVPGKITVVAGGGAKVELDANALVQAMAGSLAKLEAGKATVQANTGGLLELTANALMTSSGAAAGVSLEGAKATIGSSSGGGAEFTADAGMAGANATVTGTTQATVNAPTATLAGGGGTVEAGGSGVNVAGGEVNARGGMVNVSGGMVKIN